MRKCAAALRAGTSCASAVTQRRLRVNNPGGADGISRKDRSRRKWSGTEAKYPGSQDRPVTLSGLLAEHTLTSPLRPRVHAKSSGNIN